MYTQVVVGNQAKHIPHIHLKVPLRDRVGGYWHRYSPAWPNIGPLSRDLHYVFRAEKLPWVRGEEGKRAVTRVARVGGFSPPSLSGRLGA